MGTTNMGPLSFKNAAVQMIVIIAILTRVDSIRVPGKTGILKNQEVPQYRFHYYIQDEKTENKPQEEYKTETNMRSLSKEINPHEDMQAVNYRVDKSNEFQTDINGKFSSTPYQISLNNPIYSSPDNNSKESIISPESLPIVVEPMSTQEQKSTKSVENDSKNEQQQTESTEKVTQLIEQINANQTEDRNDDVKDEQATDQIFIQDEDTAIKQTEFTIPFKKPNFISADDFKFINNEAIKQTLVNKVIQKLNEDHEQSNPQLNFKSTLSDKPLKIIDADSMETERQENYQSSQGHSNFKSQHLSNKPLRLYGYNPLAFGSLYDMQVDYNRPSQMQQPPYNQDYFVGFGAQSDDIKQRPQLQTQAQAHDSSRIYASQPQIQIQDPIQSQSPLQAQSQSQLQAQAQAYDNSAIYFSHPLSTLQNGDYKENLKSNLPTQTQPLFYYDPSSKAMLPIYTNMIPNTYPISENKPRPIPQADSNKSGFNLLQILSGGTFYKGGEQTDISQQTGVKDSIVKQESNKLIKSKPSEITHDKVKPPQTVMFYLNPGNTQNDLKPVTSSPMQLTFGQQPQADCNGQTHKAPAHKLDKTLQPIPLCSDCKTALALVGLPSTKSTVIQQKKSMASPQVLPIWNGRNVSKRNYLVLPNPITK